MPITAFAPREVIGLSEEASSLIHSVLLQVNKQLQEKGRSFIHGQSSIEIDLGEFRGLYEKVKKEEQATFYLILRSEYMKEGWSDFALHTRDATGAKCFAITLGI